MCVHLHYCEGMNNTYFTFKMSSKFPNVICVDPCNPSQFCMRKCNYLKVWIWIKQTRPLQLKSTDKMSGSMQASRVLSLSRMRLSGVYLYIASIPNKQRWLKAASYLSLVSKADGLLPLSDVSGRFDVWPGHCGQPCLLLVSSTLSVKSRQASKWHSGQICNCSDSGGLGPYWYGFRLKVKGVGRITMRRVRMKCLKMFGLEMCYYCPLSFSHFWWWFWALIIHVIWFRLWCSEINGRRKSFI